MVYPYRLKYNLYLFMIFGSIFICYRIIVMMSFGWLHLHAESREYSEGHVVNDHNEKDYQQYHSRIDIFNEWPSKIDRKSHFDKRIRLAIDPKI